MSWAANRNTTRVEDTAYCLLGIFGVYMPMLYGEEGNAFLRLQEEIIKTVPDLGIYAWTLPRDVPSLEDRIVCSVLAKSPKEFSWDDSVVDLSSLGRMDFHSQTEASSYSLVHYMRSVLGGKDGDIFSRYTILALDPYS
jgi:hypothetical protein